MIKYLFFLVLFFCQLATATTIDKHVIILVWDGLRPDLITEKTTPHLYHLLKKGVYFKDHHALFPTLTTVNAAGLMTGNYPDVTGLFGNTLWYPVATGKEIDFKQPVFTDDEKILQYLSQAGLTLKPTLFQAAKKNGLTTAFVGNAGARFLADPTFASMSQFVPKPMSLHYLKDGVTPDPTDKHGSAYAVIDHYYATYFLETILPTKPHLSLLWLANPDGTEHDFSFCTPNCKNALQKNDQILGQLQAKLHALHLEKNTDLIILSDHAQSYISGPLSEFPLREITQQTIGKLTQSPQGYSVSGDIRAVDLMTKAGFHAYDGEGCRYDPVLSGINKNGQLLYPTHWDKTGSICGKRGAAYQTPAYKVPAVLPRDAIIVATNSSSEYFYLPSHDKKLMLKIVRFLQSHDVFGALFIDTTHYDLLPGTFSQNTIHLSHSSHPDLIASLNFNDKEQIDNLPGIEFCDYPNERGTHGSFSSIDVHNFFVAIGPDFRENFEDILPTANVDIAPTVAAILRIPFPKCAGRVITEALRDHKIPPFSLKKLILTSQTADHLTIKNASNLSIKNQHHYRIKLSEKILTQSARTYTYFDEAKAERD